MYANGRYEAILNDDERRATFVISIKEGWQFRMGGLEFSGFTEQQVRDLTSRWKLKPGDIFDNSYPADFINSHVLSLLPKTAASKVEPRLDVENGLVHVRVGYR